MAKDSNASKGLNSEYPREKLPKDLQKIVDRQDDWMDNLYEGQGPDSVETNYRYAAYAQRLRTIMLSAHRYVAYTSDIGESFRPIAHPYMVRGAYAVSWAYLVGDVSHEGWKAYQRNQRLLNPHNNEHYDATTKQEMPGVKALPTQQPMHIPAIEDYRSIMAQRAIFQGVASMGLPAFTIHSVVRYSGRALKNAANTTLRTWGPIGLGLAVVPALPYMFDEPVEKAVEWGFYHGFKAIGGEKAVGNRPVTGRSHELVKETRVAEAVKEKKS
ncbi:uncharacterized protein HMPREF1541_01428 [Cyphellophora europaea CBS 101466]|uniref:Mitochondrial fission process protein 1 n=1 Tax=Cyphellophora europaea (strain CBS 101466) TaxID=1220924 RepID=W2SES3_CYPE1|nr:uncharacterized protein HMPREF1541_01428 [Cyphellophora europaea CBS 101466]ETN47236.1 hypothetical protein HMPREF1541_01428 [Cyphellophora europaea CBS 101466]